jgi:hypothetical protein
MRWTGHIARMGAKRNAYRIFVAVCKIWGFHGGDYEECRFLGCGAVYILCEPTFRRNISPPSSGYKNLRTRNQRELVATDSSTLKMEAKRSSETSVHTNLHGTTSQKTALFRLQFATQSATSLTESSRKTANFFSLPNKDFGYFYWCSSNFSYPPPSGLSHCWHGDPLYRAVIRYKRNALEFAWEYIRACGEIAYTYITGMPVSYSISLLTELWEVSNVINSLLRLLSFENEFFACRWKRTWLAIFKFSEVSTELNALLQAARERANRHGIYPGYSCTNRHIFTREIQKVFHKSI